VSLFEGVTAVAGDNVKILKARGSNVLEDFPLIKFLNEHQGKIDLDSRKPADMISEAVSVAKKSDVVVLALGETQGMSGEAASRTRIRLPENQQALLKALTATGKPIVLVLYNGRPLVLKIESEQAQAILETWFLGSQSGNAIADVLFGDHNPSGKLTASFPYHEGQIPVFYASKNTGRPFDAKQKYTTKYLDAPNEPLYPFGWGLSYTKFVIGAPELSAAKIKTSQTLKISVKVENTGDYDGEETVQLYIRDLVASVTRPVKQLRGFQKVFLKKGESRTLTFELKEADLRFYDKDMKFVSEPGEFKVMVGGNSAELKEASFRLVK
jgi:beta-glucosidase